MKKKIKILISILFVGSNSFSQGFHYNFNNNEINKYLQQTPIENAFNNILCDLTNDTSSYSCFDNFGKIKEKKVNDSLELLIYENGKIASEIVDLKSIRIIKEFYYGTNIVFCVKKYKDDKLFNITFYTNKGEKLDIGNFKNGTGTLKYYRQNETLSAILNLNNGELNGRIRLYYSSGNIMLEGSYKDGKEIENWIEFMPKI